MHEYETELSCAWQRSLVDLASLSRAEIEMILVKLMLVGASCLKVVNV